MPDAFENRSCVIFFTTKLKPLCFDFALWVLIVSPGVKVDGGSGVVYNRASSTSKQTEMANTFYIQRKKGVFKVRFKLERDSSSFFKISICGCKKFLSDLKTVFRESSLFSYFLSSVRPMRINEYGR